MNETPDVYIIGRKYHTTWARERGMVWVLISFDRTKNQAVLETPKTKKRFTTQLNSLQDINYFADLKETNPDAYLRPTNKDKRRAKYIAPRPVQPIVLSDFPFCEEYKEPEKKKPPVNPDYVRRYREFNKDLSRNIDDENT